MADAVHVKRIGNTFILNVPAQTLAEAQSLLNIILTQKVPEAFQPEPPPLSPETEALLNRADTAEVD
jgi:hypothetical protein